MKIERIYPLSPMQSGLLFNTLLEPGSAAYHERKVFGLSGHIKRSVLEQSLNLLLEKYEVLRSRFVHEKVPRPMQVVLSGVKIELNYLDFSAYPREEKEKHLQSFEREDAATRFNLVKDLPLRVSLLKLDNESYKLYWCYHHIIMDGWCSGIVFKELLEIYRLLLNNQSYHPTPAPAYRLYIEWLEKQDKREGLQFWSDYLEGYETPAVVPRENRRINKENESQSRYLKPLDKELSEKLSDTARSLQVTENNIFQVLWGLLLQHYNNGDDVVFGIVVSGRPPELPQVEQMVGLFINTVPLRIRTNHDPSLSQALRQSHDEFTALTPYQHMPLAEIHANHPLKNRLIDHILVFENYPLEEELDRLDPEQLGFTVTGIFAEEQANYDLGLAISPGESIAIQFLYRPSVYPENTIRRIGNHLERLARQLTEDPNIPLSKLDILTSQEKQQILNDFNDTSRPYPSEKTIHQLFEEQAQRTPDAVATIGFNRSYRSYRTYKKLNRDAGELAQTLRESGVAPGHIIALETSRYTSFITGILAILKTGAAYMPIDTEYPRARIDYMLKDSNALAVITTEGHLETLRTASTPSAASPNADGACYVIYTSGSTGSPKGVLVRHRGVARLAINNGYLDLSPGQRLMQINNFAFDASAQEIWTALLNGLSLYIAPQGAMLEPARAADLLRRHFISIIMISSPLFSQLATANPALFAPLQYLLVGADILDPGHVRAVRRACPKVRIINVYGPTENTVMATYYTIEKDTETAIPIGKPVANSTAYIMDHLGRLQPFGITGEICLGGDGLALGYLNNPELTHQMFPPAQPGYRSHRSNRSYKTGDLGMVLPDGNIMFMGRKDNQVKIRGFRIELQEIKHHLQKHDDIHQSVVTVHGDSIAAYYVSGLALPEKDLKEFLLTRLPAYMLPSYFIHLIELPLTSRGKVDTSKLPSPNAPVYGKAFHTAELELEKELVEICREILELEPGAIDIDKSFFDYGGHSLNSMQLISRIQQHTGVKVPMEKLFLTPSLKELAEYIKRSNPEKYNPIEAIENKEYYPLSSAQKRLFMLQQLDKTSTAYHITATLDITGDLKVDRLERTFNELIQRHESLRTSFFLKDEEPVQRIHTAIDFLIGPIGPIGPIQKAQAFDLSQPPMMRILLQSDDALNYRLFVEMHHIITDGASMRILIKEFLALYKDEGPLTPLTIQYKDYAQWHNRLLAEPDLHKQGEYWAALLTPPLPVLELHTDYVRPSFQDHRGASVYFSLDNDLTAALRKLAKQENTTMFTLLLSFFYIFLAKASGQEDIIVGTPVAGRGHADLEPVIGMLVNTLPLRRQPTGSKTAHAFLGEVKSAVTEAFENQEYPFEMMVDSSMAERDAGRNPLFDVVFTLQKADLPDMDIPGLSISLAPEDKDVSKFDFTLTATEQDTHLDFDFRYNVKLFKQESIRSFVTLFSHIIAVSLPAMETPISRIPAITPEGRHQILTKFNDTAAGYSQDKRAIQLFQEQVEKTPDRIAMVGPVPCNNRSYRTDRTYTTYREINRRAEALAERLRKEGAGPGDIVALNMERSIEVIFAIMAVLKTGAAYMPIDPDYPEERIHYMLNDSAARIIVSENGVECRRHIKSKGGSESPANAVYIIYTSGSTGRPKGVVISDRGLVNLIFALQDALYTFNKPINVSMVAPFVFDAHVKASFPTLMGGHRLVMVPETARLDGERLIDFLKEEDITLCDGTPVHFRIMLDHAEKLKGGFPVKTVFVGGDTLDPELCRRFFGAVDEEDITILNGYGPTECSDVTSFLRITKDTVNNYRSLPVGRPINNVTVYIINRYSRMQPVGLPGEICIGGSGVAPGYLNHPELTAQTFVLKGISRQRGKEILYRSGDLGRWLWDGNLEFLGRMDHQVKIRGFRIETAEIEFHLSKHPQVYDAAVTGREDKEGGKYLAAYFTSEHTDLAAELRRHLENKLPNYMAPHYFVHLEKMPLTPSGKIDRTALPEPELKDTGTAYQPPSNPIEETLANEWRRLLKLERVGIGDNFFAAGGDSIKAIQLSAALRKQNLKLDIKNLFMFPTIKEVSRFVKPLDREISQQSVEGDVMLTPAQHRFFQDFAQHARHFNQAVMLFREEGFDAGHIKQVFSAITAHHDALRMVFTQTPGQKVRQYNRGKVEPLFEWHEFNLDEDVKEAASLTERITERANTIQSSMDIANGPLLKLGLFHTPKGDYLAIIIHHLVIDGISWRILLEDIAAAYKQILAEEKISLPQKTDSFQHWAEHQHRYASGDTIHRQRRIWQDLLTGGSALLPKDFQPAKHPRQRRYSDTLRMELSAMDTDKLFKSVNHAYRTEINDILLTALAMAIHGWTGSANIAIALEGHGRESIVENIDISRTVGWFTSLFPVVLEINRTNDLGYAIKQVKETLRRIPDKGIGYGILKYLTETGIDNPIQPETGFNFLGEFNTGQDRMDETGGSLFSVSQQGVGNPVSPSLESPYALEVSGMVSEKRLTMTFSYCTGEFRKATIQQLLDAFTRHLHAIIEHCAGIDEAILTPSDLGDTALSVEELESMGDARDMEKIYPLSPLQEGMLYHYIKDKNSHAYLAQAEFIIEGKVDAAIMEEGLNLLIQRYDILRTRFFHKGLRRPRQVVLKEQTVEVVSQDLSNLDEREINGIIDNYKDKDLARGFELSGEPSMRTALFKTGPQRYTLIWSSHHIIMDGWCLGILFKDMQRIYGGLVSGHKPELGNVPAYKDFIDWLEEKDFQRELVFWEEYMRDYDTPASPPQASVIPTVKKYQPASHSFRIEDSLTSALEQCARGKEVTLNTVLHACWGLLMQRYNGRPDVVFGSVVSGRPEEVPGIDRMVGLFINTVPVRVKSQSGETFTALIQKLQRNWMDIRNHEYGSLADIQANHPLKNDLFNHILVFENLPGAEDLEETTQPITTGFSVRDIRVIEQTNYDFNLQISPGPPMGFKFIYNAAIYDAETIERTGRHLCFIMEQVVNDPDMELEGIELLSQREKQQILFEFNDTATDYPADKTISQLFREQVEKYPHHIALSGRSNGTNRSNRTYRTYSTYMSYSELLERSKIMADEIREQGGGDIIAIQMERSIQMIIAIMAILESNAAYLPIEPDLPDERIRYMLKDTGAPLLVTAAGIEPLPLERGVAERRGVSLPAPNAQNICYIIYTSGSTGQPKGVMTTHANVTRVVRETNYIDITPEDRVLQLSNYAFDGSVFDIYGALLNGGTLVLSEPGKVASITALSRLIYREQVSLFFVTTALFNVLVDEAPEIFAVIRKLLFGGERASASHVRKALAIAGKEKLVHVYGPTETAVFATYYPIETIDEAASGIPIGKPIANTSIYILDRDLNPQPLGITGEIYIGGPGLAKGYLNNPELTAERFSSNSKRQHPDSSDMRMGDGVCFYKTGDLGRWLPGGSVEFLGRIDRQVKLRGFRIELGEIEHCLLKHGDIKEAAVIMNRDSQDGGNAYLCAYLTPVEGSPPAEDTLRRYLAQSLPPFMIPDFFMTIDSIPLTANGKIDTKKLPAPGAGAAGESFIAPRNGLERKLAAVWSQVLGIEKEQVGIDTDFFDHGGHSLKATILVSYIHKTLNVEVPLTSIFQFPTIRLLAQNIADSDTRKFIAIEAVEKKEYYPLTPAQRSIYIQQQKNPANMGYNMSQIFKVDGEFDASRMENAIKQLIHRHESLRTSFIVVDDDPVQRVHDAIDFKVQRFSNIPGKNGKTGIESDIESCIQEFIKPFDLSSAPLLRTGIIELEVNGYIWMFDMHHTIYDGASMAVLIEEFMTLYIEKESPAPLALQYKDYAGWFHGPAGQAAMRKQRRYWHNELAAPLPVLNLPWDFPRPTVPNFEGDAHQFYLAPAETAKLYALAEQENATIYMTLLAILYVLLAKLSGQDDIIVGTAVAARRHADLQSIIGMFVNSLALRGQPRENTSFLDFLKITRDKVFDAFEHQEYPYESLVSEIKSGRDLSRNPIYEVFFVLQNTPIKTSWPAGFSLERYPYNTEIGQSGLMLSAHELEDKLLLEWRYATAMLKKESVEKFSAYLLEIILQVTGNPTLPIKDITLSVDMLEADAGVSPILQDDWL